MARAANSPWHMILTFAFWPHAVVLRAHSNRAQGSICGSGNQTRVACMPDKRLVCCTVALSPTLSLLTERKAEGGSEHL